MDALASSRNGGTRRRWCGHPVFQRMGEKVTESPSTSCAVGLTASRASAI